jgi:hypothetical protein
VSETAAGLSPRTRWFVRWRAHTGRAVSRPEHAPYAVDYAERELAGRRLPQYRTVGATLVAIGVAMIVVAILSGWGGLFAAASGAVGGGIGQLLTPRSLRRSVEKNRRLLTSPASSGG